MTHLFSMFAMVSLLFFGCLTKDSSETDNRFVTYEFSPESKANYSASLTGEQIAADLKSIKTIFNNLDMETSVPLPLAKKSMVSAKKTAVPECINFSEMMKEDMQEEEGMTGTFSWTMSNGKPLTICENDANPYSKLDNSIAAMSISGVQDNVSVDVNMNFLVDILKKGDTIEGMELTISAHMKAVVLGIFNLEAVISGVMKGDIFSDDEPQGHISLDLAILDGRYRCKTTMDMSIADEEDSAMPACQITHNNSKVGTLDFTQDPPVIFDALGNSL